METQGEESEAWGGVMLDTDFGDLHRHYENTRLDLEATAIGTRTVLVRGTEDEHKSRVRSGAYARRGRGRDNATGKGFWGLR